MNKWGRNQQVGLPVDAISLDVHPLTKKKEVEDFWKENWQLAYLLVQYNTSKYNTFLHTIKRTQLYVGLCGRRTTHLPLLTKRHRQLRLYSTRERCDWIMDKWERVSWWNELRFAIYHIDDCVQLPRLQGEQLLLQCTTGHKRPGGGGIMLWGTFS